MTPQELYKRYSSAMAYISVQKPNGDQGIGSAFHVGEGIFITARHVVEGNKILKICTTEERIISDPNGLMHYHNNPGTFTCIFPGCGTLRSGPFYHPNSQIDVAALIVDGLDPEVVPLGSHLDDWINDEAFILASVLVLGYPPIPFSRSPVLFAARAEINAVIDKYTGGHPHFIVSTMARGGFSGGLCMIEWDFALGVVTESLVSNHSATELGYMAVLTVEPIYECLAHHKLIPAVQKEGGDGFWDT
jgi:hypothetical protein